MPEKKVLCSDLLIICDTLKVTEGFNVREIAKFYENILRSLEKNIFIHRFRPITTTRFKKAVAVTDCFNCPFTRLLFDLLEIWLLLVVD